jgi:hypothetical protein
VERAPVKVRRSPAFGHTLRTNYGSDLSVFGQLVDLAFQLPEPTDRSSGKLSKQSGAPQ